MNIIKDLQRENKEMSRILKEISKHILDSTVFDEFTDETRCYLSDLNKQEFGKINKNE